MSSVSRVAVLLCVCVISIASAGGCDAKDGSFADGTSSLSATSEGGNPGAGNREGSTFWMRRTYGNERFLYWLPRHPSATRQIRVAVDAVLSTPRWRRHAEWGTVNHPDCVANTAESYAAGGQDICPHAEPMDPLTGWPTGVVGIRKYPNTPEIEPDPARRAQNPYLYGVACGACHAGFNPLRPPADPNEPDWNNIDELHGNEFIRVGKVLGYHMAAADPRRQLLASWPPGTVDPTVIYEDSIRNPLEIPPLYSIGHRPLFWNSPTPGAPPELVHRLRQGGEDDRGFLVAFTRVYTNLGTCYFECVADTTMVAPDGTRGKRASANDPIDLEQCRRDCPELPALEDLQRMYDWMAKNRGPKYPGLEDADAYARGEAVFQRTCASCHIENDLLSDSEVKRLGPEDPSLGASSPIDTNRCAALTTNWDRGKVWQTFSGENYKTRGYKGYRTIELEAAWSSGKLLHTKTLGETAPPTASALERGEAFARNLRLLLTRDRPKLSFYLTEPVTIAGLSFAPPVPIGFVFNRNFTQSPHVLTCDDFEENHGHTFGADLPPADKEDLIHFLLHQ